LKKKASAITAILLALVIAFTPVAALAAPAENLHSPLREANANEPNPFDDLRIINLDVATRAIVLEDFDYLVARILAVAPTQNIIYRRFGMTAADFFAVYRGIIFDMTPLPSFLSFFEPDRWGDASTDQLHTAADYLFTIMLIISDELGGLGHIDIQLSFMVEQTFFAWESTVRDIADMLGEDWYDYGYTLDDILQSVNAWLRFYEFQLAIYNQPSVLWFYDIDPDEFDFDLDVSEVLGLRDYNNITTEILGDSIAYIRIASFINNMRMDADVLFDFYEEIHGFEHLIIDIRGNTGGWVAYFPNLIAAMLMGENASFTHYEMFIDNPATSGLFVDPISMVGGVLSGVYPVAEFVESRNMPYFNLDDLALLDYVLVWEIDTLVYHGHPAFEGEIWLLVDERSMSASEMAASFSISTGFATVVGEPTAGVTGVLYTFIAAPNTGILMRIDLGYTVDSYGRSLEEYGVVPQIANAPGMDALETVLAIIADEFVTGVPASGILVIPPPPPPAAPVTEAAADMTGFIALRYAANSHGYSVEWDGENNSALVISEDGSVRVVPISENNVFNDNGTVYVPLWLADELFAVVENEDEPEYDEDEDEDNE